MADDKRLLVTGSRHWRAISVVRAALTPYRGHGLVLVHGDGDGLDRMAGGIWRAWDEIEHPMPADWGRYGKRAGPLRNQAMVDLGNYVACLAFPLVGSRGTWDCVERAVTAGIDVTYP